MVQISFGKLMFKALERLKAGLQSSSAPEMPLLFRLLLMLSAMVVCFLLSTQIKSSVHENTRAVRETEKSAREHGRSFTCPKVYLRGRVTARKKMPI